MVDAARIREAAARISSRVYQTPLILSESLSELTGSRVYLKCENFQRTGSFKVRGAFNKLLGFKDGECAVAASMGNHAQGVAAAAGALGIDATIVMPEGASPAKENAVRAYGAEVVLHGHALTESIAHARSMKNCTFVHPYDDEDVIAGQGTVGLEITEQIERADAVLVPVGGGGLISGIATFVKSAWPQSAVIGVQTGSATSALDSFREGRVVDVPPAATLADGIAVGRVGSTTLEHMKKYVDEIRSVGESSIAKAVLVLLERKKLVVEGAGAVGLALLMEDAVTFKGKTVVLVISGGNIDFTLMDRIIRRGLKESGRTGSFEVVIDDVPGQLHRLTGIIADRRGNILDVHHDRLAGGIPVQKTAVRVTVEVKNREHLARIIEKIRAEGIELKEDEDD